MIKTDFFKLVKVVNLLILTLALPLGGYVSAQESNLGLSEGEWYVRLVVESKLEGLSDRGNVLGQLNESGPGKDTHDLKELNPFSSPYLSVVFHQPDWGSEAGSYSSDYRGMDESDAVWAFEVRSDDVNREVTLSWDGSDRNKLLQSILIDEQTGEEIRIAEMGISGSGFIIAPLNYVFNMGGESVRHFRWALNTDRIGVRSTERAPQRSSSITSIQAPALANGLTDGEEIAVFPQVMRTNYYLGEPPLTN